MKYELKYKDEFGNMKNASITAEDSVEAIKNDYEELLRKYNPDIVAIQRLQAKAGEAMHLKITVKAPTHYLASSSDDVPKACNYMDVFIICYPGYPLKSVSVHYDKSRYLASPNVFRSGNACIDTWIPFTSSLISVVDKLVRDIIHDPNVTRYESMANSSMKEWHMKGVSSGKFPTIMPKLLYAPERRALPPRRAAKPAAVNTRSLPKRHH